MAQWQCLHGPGNTAFFLQQHHAGRFAASDFAVMNSLNAKFAGAKFDHTLLPCVLTYSNPTRYATLRCDSGSLEHLLT